LWAAVPKTATSVTKTQIKSLFPEGMNESLPEGKDVYEIKTEDDKTVYMTKFLSKFHAEKALKAMSFAGQDISLEPNQNGYRVKGLSSTPYHFAYSGGWLAFSEDANTLENIKSAEKGFTDKKSFELLSEQKILEGEKFTLWDKSTGTPKVATKIADQWNAQFPYGGWAFWPIYENGAQLRFVSRLKENVKVDFKPKEYVQNVPEVLKKVPFDAPLVFVHRDLATEMQNTLEFFRIWHPNLAVVWKSAMSGLLVEKTVPAEDFDALVSAFSGESALIFLPNNNEPKFAMVGEKTDKFNEETILKIMKASAIKAAPKLVERKLEDGSTLQEFELSNPDDLKIERKTHRKFTHVNVADSLHLLIMDTHFVLTNKFNYGEKIANMEEDTSLSQATEVQDALIRRFSPSGGYVIGQTKQMVPLITQATESQDEALPPLFSELNAFDQLIMTQRFDGQKFVWDGVLTK
jgi:hypothetical protein